LNDDFIINVIYEIYIYNMVLSLKTLTM
jgi:hypothetical protein